MTDDQSGRAVTRDREVADGLRPGEGADLLAIGLLVFFVSLLLIVAALLVLPLAVG